MSIDKIRSALETALTGVSGLPAARAWENVDFEPTIGTPFVRAILAPTRVSQATLGNPGHDKYEGLYFVDLFYPQGAGPGASMTVVANLLAAFRRGQEFTSGGVKVHCLKAEAVQARDAEAWYQTPIAIQWYAFLN